MQHYGTSSSDNKDTEERRESRYGSTSQGENSNPFNEMLSFKLFSDSDIMKATNDLSDSCLIGKGGFGSVYKGTVADVEVAIKILDAKSTQGANEFVQEMAVLKNLKHENLVMLMGACLELRALVYEYVPRGNLEDCLVSSPRFLTWKIRIRIVYEICSVLIFLHSRKPKPLVHGDLKPHNILLDANFHCKLSDFGLSRYLTEFSDNTGAYLQTKSINGTDWYIDPDYIEFGKLTPGCDVYSFGVTILRILTGQPPFRIYRKVRKASRSKSLMEIVDSTAGDWPVDIAENLATFGVNCCKDNKDRLKFVTEISTYLRKHLAEIPQLPPFSPTGESCSKMDLTAIHDNLVSTHYKADEEITTESSFQVWAQEARDALEMRKLGDVAFSDKDSEQAIEGYFQDTIKKQVATKYLRPHTFEVPTMNLSKARKKPVGMLQANVVRAYKLKKKDLMGKSDPYPYVTLKLTEDQLSTKKTSVKRSNLNPEWNEEFNFIVKDLESQALEISVYDWEQVGKHDKMGMNVVPLKGLNPDEPISLTLDLLKNMDPNDAQNEKSRGQVVVELTYKPFKEDQAEDISDDADVVEKAPEGTPLGGGLLVVTVHEAQDLEGKHHMNPYVRILFRGEEKKTKHIKKIRDPRWKEEFQFVCEEPPANDRLHVEVLSRPPSFGIHSKETLGYVVISLANVISKRRINEKFHLIDSKNGMIQIELQWRTS